MSSSNVLYCETWNITQYFPDRYECETKHTLTISETQKGHELRIVEHYVGMREGVGDVTQMPPPYPGLAECVKCALKRMHDNKYGLGDFNLKAGISVEKVIRECAGFTQEEARRISFDEVNPMIDCEMLTKLCENRHSNNETWNRLVNRVNKKVAFELYRDRARV